MTTANTTTPAPKTNRELDNTIHIAAISHGLSKCVDDVIRQMAEQGKLNAIIEQHVQEAVGQIIKDCFSYNSNFRSCLTAHINENLKIDFTGLGLAGYQATLLKIIQDRLDGSIFKSAKKQIEDGLDEMLNNPPEQITLGDLCELLRKSRTDYERREGDISLDVKWSDTCDGYASVYLDRKPDKFGHDCEFTLQINNTGEVFRVSIPYEGDISKKIFAGPFYGFEKVLFQMYACKTKLILNRES